MHTLNQIISNNRDHVLSPHYEGLKFAAAVDLSNAYSARLAGSRMARVHLFRAMDNVARACKAHQYNRRPKCDPAVLKGWCDDLVSQYAKRGF
jgi:hypothetical protein